MAPYFLNNFNLFNDLSKNWWYFSIDNVISGCVYFLIRHVFLKKNSTNIHIILSHGVSINFNFDFRISNQFWIYFLLLVHDFSLINSSLFNFNLATLLSLLINFIIIYQLDFFFFFFFLSLESSEMLHLVSKYLSWLLCTAGYGYCVQCACLRMRSG